MAAFAKNARTAFAVSSNILKNTLPRCALSNSQLKRLYSNIIVKTGVSALLNQVTFRFHLFYFVNGFNQILFVQII